MQSISAVHVRTFARMVQGSPDMLVSIFRGTSFSVEDIDDPDFQLPIQDFWTIFDNVGDMFGEGWFLNFPILWSQELQTEVGLAMRLAPNLGAALDLVKTYWLPRWPIGSIELVRTPIALHIVVKPTYKMKKETWAAALSILALNFFTMQKAAIVDPKGSRRIGYQFSFAPTAYAERLSELIEGEVSWEQAANRLVIPNDLLKARSVLANNKQLDILLSAIENSGDQVADMPAHASIKGDVVALLDAVEQGQAKPEDIARQLGVSKRSLERRLMEEGTSFRELSAASLKKRMSALLVLPGSNAETIAFQLGYHDGSSVMRACKRWFGKPMSQVRKDLRASA